MLEEVILNRGYEKEVKNFQCNDEPLVEEFLKRDAFRLQDDRTAITRLYFDKENQNIVGFFTLFNEHVMISKGKRLKHNWTLEKNIQNFPAIRLHYMGVDQRYRGNRFGEYILLEALDKCYQLSWETGCNFVTVEALNNSIPFYEKYQFISLSKGNNTYYNMTFKLSNLDM